MNIQALHEAKKAVATKIFFKAEEGNVIALQILKDEQLKEHVTKVPALLVCVSGSVVFGNENGIKVPLKSGDYVAIDPMVKHWVEGKEDSQLLLVK